MDDRYHAIRAGDPRRPQAQAPLVPVMRRGAIPKVAIQPLEIVRATIGLLARPHLIVIVITVRVSASGGGETVRKKLGFFSASHRHGDPDRGILWWRACTQGTNPSDEHKHMLPPLTPPLTPRNSK